MGTRKRHTAEQIIAKLREADVELGRGLSVGQIWSSLGYRPPAPETVEPGSTLMSA